jgi:hypothetical protein
MIDNEKIQERLVMIHAMIATTLDKYVGMPMNDMIIEAATQQVRKIIIQLDMVTPGPAVSDLVDVCIEPAPDDPTILRVRFKRKKK